MDKRGWFIVTSKTNEIRKGMSTPHSSGRPFQMCNSVCMCGLAKKEPLKPFVTILNGKKETPYPKQHTFLSAKYITPLEIVFMWL